MVDDPLYIGTDGEINDIYDESPIFNIKIGQGVDQEKLMSP